ncbi:MAG: methionyl-tRNA formyltransferase [Treponemataceae bacterium]
MLKIVYAGSPEISSIPLKDLFESGKVEIVAVLTNPPSSKGRKGHLEPTPVEQVAREFSSKSKTLILSPEKLDEQVRQQITLLKPDLLVCFAYGKIFGPKFMSLFPLGGINLHPSLLPRYRGSAPVPAAILNMDKQTGITIQTIEQEMDSGDILFQTQFPIEQNDNSEIILNKVANQGAELFLQVLEKIENKTISPVKQDSTKATYSKMLKKEDGLIDWTQSAEQIDAKIRAFTPWPGAFTFALGTSLKIHEASVYDDTCTCKDFFEKSEKLKETLPGTVLGFDKNDKNCGILVKTGKGILVLKKLQWQTKKAMNCKDFLNGCKDFLNCVCGKDPHICGKK